MPKKTEGSAKKKTLDLGDDIQSLKAKSKKKTVKPVALLEQGRVRVRDVLVLPSHDHLNKRVVSNIAESFPLTGGGPINPITVRRVREHEDGEEVTKTVLVAGAQRLEAARCTDQKYISCTYFEGDETEARVVQIAENLFRNDLTVLQHAELLAEWVELVKAKGYFSGQRVRIGKLGRPLGGLSQFARELPLVGQTFEARRKIIQRATKIARIAPKAKNVATAAGLDDNQKALLQIAKAGGPKAQRKRAKELAELVQKAIGVEKRSEDQLSASAPGHDHQQEGNDDVESPPLQPSSDKKPNTSQSKGGKQADVEPPIADTTFETLKAVLWQKESRKLWAYTPFGVRQQFIEMLRRARCKAPTDVADFIRDVFWGRKDVGVEDLYHYAKARGFPTALIRKTLKALSYRRTKPGRMSGTPWHYVNKDPGFPQQKKLISDDELSAPLAAESKKYSRPTRELLSDDDYYKDVV